MWKPQIRPVVSCLHTYVIHPVLDGCIQPIFSPIEHYINILNSMNKCKVRHESSGRTESQWEGNGVLCVFEVDLAPLD